MKYIRVKVDRRKTKFCPHGHNKDIVGRFAYGGCKACKKIYTNAWRVRNPEEAKKRSKISNDKRQKNGKLKNWHLQTHYNINLDQFKVMLKKQDNKCAICKLKSSRSLHVDHNHNTKEVRGLLCYKCNSLLGYSQDNIKILKSAIKFLMKGKK